MSCIIEFNPFNQGEQLQCIKKNCQNCKNNNIQPQKILKILDYAIHQNQQEIIESLIAEKLFLESKIIKEIKNISKQFKLEEQPTINQYCSNEIVTEGGFQTPPKLMKKIAIVNE